MTTHLLAIANSNYAALLSIIIEVIRTLPEPPPPSDAWSDLQFIMNREVS